MKLQPEEKELLLVSAREAIEAQFNRKSASVPTGGIFDKKLGVFATLKEFGRLKGCCGYPYPHMALGKATVAAAQNAAFHDPRFPPLKSDQLQNIKIDLSVLTEPKLLTEQNRAFFPDLIRIGIDGLLIRSSARSGLLLPVVAKEYKMDSLRFLQAVCHKAGLPPDTWQEKSCEVYTFQAEIISE